MPIAGRRYFCAIDCLQGRHRWGTRSGSVSSAAPAPRREFESVFSSYRQVRQNQRPFSVKGSFLREDSGPVFVYIVVTSFIG